MASVDTFMACCDVIDACNPQWCVFENVQTIDREVDKDTQLDHSKL